MIKLVREKSFYTSIAAIALPIALQNLITFSVNLADTIMLGRADKTEVLLSASSLANQPFFILSLVCFGLAGAATVLSAQYWGKRDVKTIRTIFSMILKAAFFASLIFGLTVLLVQEQVMKLYTTDPAKIAAGCEYLRIIGFSYILFALSNTMICLLRCLEIVKISVVVNVLSLLTNIFLNWVLIFGHLGAPAMGIRGAAIATLCARLVEFIVTFIYVFLIDKRLSFRPRHILKFDRLLAKDLVRYGTPVFINEVIWSLGITLQAALLGHITYSAGDPVAANSIASMVQQLATIVIFGIANAAAVVVGKTIGENNIPRAKLQAHTLKYLSFLVGAAACILILLLKDFVVDFYVISEETKALAKEMLVVIAVITFFVSTSALCIVGVLRGAGDTRFCLAAEMISLWVVALPCAFVAAFLLHLPVPLVLLFMKIDEPLKVLLCIIRMRKDQWIRAVTRETTAASD